MKENGYTLAEMLVAVVIVGLAIGGLTGASRLIGSLEGATTHAAARGVAMKVSSQRFTKLFEDAGPFLADNPAGLVGSAGDLTFACGQAAPCRAHLSGTSGHIQLELAGPGWASSTPLPGADNARFIYSGADGDHAAWPTPDGGRLTSVTIARNHRDNSVVIMTAPLWVEQSPDCQFDAISGKCRDASP